MGLWWENHDLNHQKGWFVHALLNLAPRLGVGVKHPQIVHQFLVDRGAHPAAEHKYALANCCLGVSEPDAVISGTYIVEWISSGPKWKGTLMKFQLDHEFGRIDEKLKNY